MNGKRMNGHGKNQFALGLLNTLVTGGIHMLKKKKKSIVSNFKFFNLSKFLYLFPEAGKYINCNNISKKNGIN